MYIWACQYCFKTDLKIRESIIALVQDSKYVNLDDDEYNLNVAQTKLAKTATIYN